MFHSLFLEFYYIFILISTVCCSQWYTPATKWKWWGISSLPLVDPFAICSMIGLYRLWMPCGTETSLRTAFLREIHQLRVQHIALHPTGSASGRRPQAVLHDFVQDESLLHQWLVVPGVLKERGVRSKPLRVKLTTIAPKINSARVCGLACQRSPFPGFSKSCHTYRRAPYHCTASPAVRICSRVPSVLKAG